MGVQFATVKIEGFNAFTRAQVILADGRDIAPELYISEIEIKAPVDDYTMIKLTCTARVEAQGWLDFDSNVHLGLTLANAVRYSGWR